MKINEKFENYKITTVCENLSSKARYPIGKKDDSRFYLINFYPSGEPEAFIIHCYSNMTTDDDLND